MITKILHWLASLRPPGSAALLDKGRAPEPRERRSLALGIERVGLVSLARPAMVGTVTVILIALAAIGIFRLHVDDSVSQLFRSDTPEFKQYEAESRRFPSSEFDVLVAIHGST